MKDSQFTTKLIAVSFMFLSACSTTPKSDSQEEKDISTAKINDRLGLAYLEEKKVERAKQKLLLALDQAPSIPETWYSMAYFLEVTGAKEDAKKYYLKAISIAPKRGDVQNNYGTFLCRMGEYQTAIQHFNLAAQDIKYIDTASAYENAALCALKIPNKELAAAYFSKALTADPDRSLSAFQLAKINYEEGHYQKSKLLLEQYLAMESPSKETYDLGDKIDAKLGALYAT